MVLHRGLVLGGFVMRVSTIVASFILALGSTPLLAIPKVDQADQFNPSLGEGFFTRPDVGVKVLQTFTVGRSGVMTLIDIPLYRHDFSLDIFSGINIYATSGGIPTSIIATGTVKTVSFDDAFFDLAMTVTDGQMLALEPILVSGESLWKADVDNHYSRGMTVAGFGGKWFAAPDQDRNFVTYVDADAAIAPVPELSTWALLVGGFGAVGSALRRRTKAVVRQA